MTALALLAESNDGGQLAEIARTFGVDWPHLSAQMISFSIVCALLYLLAYKPVLKMLEERRQQIALGLANAEKINAALAAIEEQRQQTLGAARQEATRLIAEAHDIARRVDERQKQRAMLAGEQILRKAHEDAEQEHIRMMAELRREVGHLVVMTTAAVTGKILTADDQRRLADETVRELQ